ncbi:unnamed protein product, partial [Mesorhabditis spiculigera]
MCGAISAQSFATDMCVPANIHQHGATIIPHHLHQPMSASTCRITDPRPSDTSNNRSSPQRTAAHARPSAALSRRTGLGFQSVPRLAVVKRVDVPTVAAIVGVLASHVPTIGVLEAGRHVQQIFRVFRNPLHEHRRLLQGCWLKKRLSSRKSMRPPLGGGWNPAQRAQNEGSEKDRAEAGIRVEEIQLEDLHDQIHEAEKNLFAAPTLKKKKTGKKELPRPVDGMLDPEKFSEVETANLNQVSSEFMDRMDAFDEAQNEAISAAFADDDVIEILIRKRAVYVQPGFLKIRFGLEEAEKEKDIDLSLPGWGSWTGPNVAPKKKKDNRFIIKGREVKRKIKAGLASSFQEKIESSITKFQPKDVPFANSRMEDFEAAVRPAHWS